MKQWLFLLFCMVLSGCASTRIEPHPELLFNDQLFTRPQMPVSATEVFALSDEMKRYLDTELAGQSRTRGMQQALLDALYKKSQLRLEYDSAMTRNAAQAFQSRKGNCLSLVIMTAAFARQLGLQVRYNNVFVEEIWSRNGNINFLNGHVNLTLGKGNQFSQSVYDSSALLTVDFLPSEDLRGQRSEVIEENTIIAMYMNNRAAESLAQGQLNQAYWFAREAIVQAPDFFAAYNTLGVIYQRHGNLAQAEQAFRQVLEQEPENTRTMSNLARVLSDLGRVGESQLLERRLVKLEPYPPFYFFQLGQAAMEKEDFKAAKALFTREAERADYSHEIHFWLAVANFRLGDLGQAGKHMNLALENSTTRSDRDLYAAKLDRIRSHRTQ